MSSIAEQIVDYLEDQSIGTAATDLFANFKPAQAPDDCIIIYDRPGTTEFEIPTNYPMFQVYVRNTSNAAGYQKALQVFNALHSKANVTLVSGGNYFYWIRANQTPSSIGRDESERSEFSMNFDTYVRA